MGRGKVDKTLKMSKRYQIMVTESDAERIEDAKTVGGYTTASDLIRDGLEMIIEKIKKKNKK